MTRRIEKWQLKAIYALGGSLRIARHGSRDDELHEMVRGLTGKESVKSLSYQEASYVIGELQTRMKGFLDAPSAPKKRKKTYQDTPGGMTGGQQAKVWYLMTQLAGCDREKGSATLGERLAGIIRKEFKFEVDKHEPLQWFTAGQGWQLIEILKKYVASAEKKYMRG